MPDVAVYNMQREKVGSVDFPEGAANPALLHQSVVAQRRNGRQGTSKVKSRHEVSGSTRKIYRQKGTGRARHGDIKAPLFVGGGRAFGPRPRDHTVRLPQKIRRGALRAAIFQRKGEGKLLVLEMDFKEPKTREAARLFSRFEIPGALVVLGEGEKAVEKSIRNLPRFQVCRAEALSVLEILRHDHLVISHRAYEKVVATLGGGQSEPIK